jgi:hypothetical protein
MKLKITAIRDAGNLDKERVVIKVESTTDIGQYVLLCVDSTNGKPTTSVRNTFWFPDKSLNPGDFVVVYTKRGRPSEKEFKDAVSHFYYWGIDKPIWASQNLGAIILFAPDWESFIPSPA